jgi:hypothetical protein
MLYHGWCWCRIVNTGDRYVDRDNYRVAYRWHNGYGRVGSGRLAGWIGHNGLRSSVYRFDKLGWNI